MSLTRHGFLISLQHPLFFDIFYIYDLLLFVSLRRSLLIIYKPHPSMSGPVRESENTVLYISQLGGGFVN